MPITIFSKDSKGKDRCLHIGSSRLHDDADGIGVAIAIWKGPDIVPPPKVEHCVLDPDKAEDVAAKLIQSAAIARHANGDGKRPSFGPKGRQKMLNRFAVKFAKMAMTQGARS